MMKKKVKPKLSSCPHCSQTLRMKSIPHGEHSPFVPIALNAAVGWLFEHGYAKEYARYFQSAGNSFRTMLKKLPDRSRLNISTNGECSLPHVADAF